MGAVRLNPADSGWQALPLASGFAAYDAATAPRYRKAGGVVQVAGAVKLSSGTLDASAAFASLPEGFRPAARQVFVCQGSSLCTWMLSVYASGEMRMERYRSGGAAATVTTSTWLPFSATFLAG